VHDGLYVSPSFSHSEIALASEAASTASGLPALQLSLRNLTTLWQRQFGHLERQTTLQYGQAKSSKHAGEFCFEDGASHPSQVSTGHVLHFATQTRKLIRKRAHVHLAPPHAATLTPTKIRKVTYSSRINRQRVETALDTPSTSSTLHAYFSKKRLFGE
jgi:hypothetical protein